MFQSVSQRGGREVKILCRCSFLEIYKEVITDLLHPAATRLQIREDIKKGVYVEGLTQDLVFSGAGKKHSFRTALQQFYSYESNTIPRGIIRAGLLVITGNRPPVKPRKSCFSSARC
jgi:Kinesin motor domain